MKTKSKPVTASSIKKNKGTLVIPQQIAAHTEDFGADPHFWSSEISAIKEQKFQTVEAAIDAIADRVVSRMFSGSMEEADTKKFVAELLSSNDEVVRTLREVFGIQN